MEPGSQNAETQVSIRGPWKICTDTTPRLALQRSTTQKTLTCQTTARFPIGAAPQGLCCASGISIEQPLPWACVKLWQPARRPNKQSYEQFIDVSRVQKAADHEVTTNRTATVAQRQLQTTAMSTNDGSADFNDDFNKTTHTHAET